MCFVFSLMVIFILTPAFVWGACCLVYILFLGIDDQAGVPRRCIHYLFDFMFIGPIDSSVCSDLLFTSLAPDGSHWGPFGF